MAQLQLLFPNEKLSQVVIPPVPAGFTLRTYREGDAEAYIELMKSAGFDYWNMGFVERTLANAFSESIFFAVENSTGRLAATIMCNRPKDGETRCELGWLGTNPDFRGKGLARLVYSAALKRFHELGQKDIYLLTDDFRLPALKLYLSDGWIPNMHAEDHPLRWAALYANPLLAPYVTQETDPCRFHGYFPEEVKTIGIVSPGSCPTEAGVNRGAAFLKAAGYNVKIMPNATMQADQEHRVPAPDDDFVNQHRGYLPYFKNSLPAEYRLADFYQAWEDPEVDMILCSRGGFGCRDLLKAFDWERLAKRPDMRVMGFSDCTLLGLAFAQRGIGHPIMGPLCTTLGDLPLKNIRWSADMLNGRETQPVQLKAVVPGDISGKPLAGVISRYAFICDTPYQPDAHGRVFFLENLGVPPKAWLRDFEHCHEHHLFDGAAGFVVCHYVDCGTEEEVYSGMKSLAERVGCPLYMGFEFGHQPANNAIDLIRCCAVKDGVLTFPAVR